MQPINQEQRLGYEWFKISEEANLILSFKGDFSQDLIKAMVLLAEKNNQGPLNNQVISSRMFAVLVECLQNISKHVSSVESNNDFGHGLILVAKNDKGFVVSSGNLVTKQQAEELKDKLELLQKLNKDELKAKHKEVLSVTELSSKSGAGLGLIGIFRKSSRVDFQLKTVDDHKTFFGLQVTISAN